jgi:hypothetical protein
LENHFDNKIDGDKYGDDPLDLADGEGEVVDWTPERGAVAPETREEELVEGGEVGLVVIVTDGGLAESDELGFKDNGE